MKQRFAMEILNESPAFCGFAYFDTEDHLADFLFADAEIDVEILREYGVEEEPYRVIECRIPKDQRDGFLSCINLLPQADLPYVPGCGKGRIYRHVPQSHAPTVVDVYGASAYRTACRLCPPLTLKQKHRFRPFRVYRVCPAFTLDNPSSSVDKFRKLTV